MGPIGDATARGYLHWTTSNEIGLLDHTRNWQLRSWEDYRDVKRLGRKTRLPEQQRSSLWSLFEKVKKSLRQKGLLTRAAMFSELARKIAQRRNPSFDFAVVDEAQDVSVAQLRFLAALGDSRPNSLFFAGDLGQRIFQTPFSWKSLGVDIRGRSQTLRINYRTSHQIRKQADRLLGPEVADVDGNADDRRGTISVFNGPDPDIRVFDTVEEEASSVAVWLKERSDESILPHEIGIFGKVCKSRIVTVTPQGKGHVGMKASQDNRHQRR